MKTSTSIIIACGVLHNLSLMLEGILDLDLEEEEADEIAGIPLDWEPGDGFLVRDEVIWQLFG